MYGFFQNTINIIKNKSMKKKKYFHIKKFGSIFLFLILNYMYFLKKSDSYLLKVGGQRIGPGAVAPLPPF